MKKLLLLAIATLSFVPTTNASHVLGMSITYEYTGNGNDYIFKLRYYRDCAGIVASPTALIELTSSCQPGFNVTLQQVSYSQIPVNPCAGIFLTTCQGGTTFGFEEYIYTGVANVPPCADWIAKSSICCRTAWITNLVNPDFYNLYVETSFDNLNFPGNSSPDFNATPVNYYCAGIPSIKDYSAIDIDGDSLHYELVPVEDAPGVALQMTPGYTYDQPLATFVPTYLDPMNGMLVFTASSIQVSSVGLQISEYRNGILIGKVKSDDEIVVATGIANPDTVTGRVYVDHNSSGVFDAGDQPLVNVVLQMMPGNMFTTTSGNGKYEFFTIDGIWDITVPNSPQYTTCTPASINVNTNGITFSDNNDFIHEFVTNINDLGMTLNRYHNPVPGQYYPMFITYENFGTTIQTNIEITLVLDTLLEFVNSMPAPANISGDTLTWTFPSLFPFMYDNINILTKVDSMATIGAPVYCSATLLPVLNDTTPSNNSDFINDIVAASYDPNYKEVVPAGDVDLSFISSQDWLTYTIYFQNLGTAPAQMVYISDLLDPDLEYASLEFVSSSYPCAMTLSGANELEFTFTGINLPAASVNEPASHGFVEYRIRPKSTLLPGTYITNNAGIYFDFNTPVYTNLVHNKVVTSVGIEENAGNGDQITVYPVPASDYCILELNAAGSREVEIEIYNLMGLLVKKHTQKLDNGINRVTIPVAELSNGNYFISVTGNNGKLVSKFTVVR